MHNNRSSARETPEFRVGSWRVVPTASELCDGERVVHLRPKVMDLLVALAVRPGEVCSKAELLDAVWPDVVVTEASLSVAVAELRGAFGDSPSRPRWVETIPRRGYRLIAPVMEGDTSPCRPRPPSAFVLSGEGVSIRLREGRTVVGRAPGCDVRLDSHHVSRAHAAFEVHGGRVVVEDLGSKNGTFVGERPIDAATELRPGDRLRLGRHAAVLQLIVDSGSTWTELSSVQPAEEPGM